MNSNKTNQGKEINFAQLENIARAAEIVLIGVGRQDVVLGRQIKENGDIVIYTTWVTFSRLEDLTALCKRHKMLYYITPELREEVRRVCPTVNGIGSTLRVHILPEYRS